jgi:flagellar hook-associated protein 3 FlgL
MAVNRVTQNLMTQRSLGSLQQGLGRLSKIQEQLSTGRVLNRPSDSPSDTTSAMRIRASLADQQQYARNAQDGLGWLGQVDNTLSGMSDQLRRARDLALQGANSGAVGPAARDALATEVDQIREGLLSSANSSYLGRPVFGGITAGDTAYAENLAGQVVYAGTPGAVNRVVGDGVVVDVQMAGPDAFGPDGTSVFDQLDALSIALRSGNDAGIQQGINDLNSSMDRVTSALADVGTRYSRLEKATQLASDTELSLTTSLSELENVDLPKAMVDLQMQEVAYQAALATTARVLQPSLVDFLR